MPADILYLVLICAATIFGFWITLWLISLAVDDSSIGDPLYPVGMAITAGVFYLICDGNPARQNLVLGLTLIWAARLAWHIGARNWGREDPRYARLRTHAASLGQNYAWYSLTHVFLSLGAASGVAIAFPLPGAAHAEPRSAASPSPVPRCSASGSRSRRSQTSSCAASCAIRPITIRSCAADCGGIHAIRTTSANSSSGAAFS